MEKTTSAFAIRQKGIKLLDHLLQVIYPRICPGCHVTAVHEYHSFCMDCFSELPFTDHFTSAENEVSRHFYGRASLTNAGSLLYFRQDSRVQEIIHEIKYRRNKDAAYTLGLIAGHKIMESPLYSGTEVMIPVPLHASREFKRGYNQSAVFSMGIREITGIHLEDQALKKIKATETQTRKDRIGRVQNMSDTIKLAESSPVYGRHVLLLDDVVTTGATLEACIHSVFQGQPASVSVLTIAVTI
jgi:ComF family protein